jgi:proline iminopeptidase
VYLHQRGSGKSLPLGETRQNTLQHLIADLEALRAQLEIPRWAVAGGSWGSTLGLAYAQSHPQRCLALLLNGIFLGRRSDVAWFFSGSRAFFLQAHEAFVGFLPEGEREDYFGNYAKRIMHPDPAIHRPAVAAWSAFEGSIATLIPNDSVLAMFQDSAFALAYARMNVHYFSNGCFLDDAPLLDRIDAVRSLPCILVHARYDMAAAYSSAVELARAWPEAELITVPAAGHSRFEPANVRALLEAQERLKTRLGVAHESRHRRCQAVC